MKALYLWYLRSVSHRGPCCTFGCFDAALCGHTLRELLAMQIVMRAHIRTGRRVWSKESK